MIRIFVKLKILPFSVYFSAETSMFLAFLSPQTHAAVL